MSTDQAPLFFEDEDKPETTEPETRSTTPKLRSTQTHHYDQHESLIVNGKIVDRNSTHRGPRRLYLTLEEWRQSKVRNQQAYRRRQKDEAKHFRTQFTGEEEWYTPVEYIEASRQVLGGIDLDPATSEDAQKVVQAITFFTEKDNGLIQTWHGRIYLNPPYTQPLIEHFVFRLVGEVDAGHVSAAILLTHNYSDTKWFHRAQRSSTRMCNTTGRVKFVNAQGKKAAPTQGQTFFYFGPNPELFRSIFKAFGDIVIPDRG